MSTLPPGVRWIAKGLMLCATVAFVQQGSIAAASMATAAAGFMPQPAESLSGMIHVHGKVAGHVHTHRGDEAGHTHEPADHDDETANSPSWTLGSVYVVSPQSAALTVFFEFQVADRSTASGQRDGLDPDGLSRPPSTPSIA